MKKPLTKYQADGVNFAGADAATPLIPSAYSKR